MGDMAYVAIHSCGRIVAATCIRSETKRHAARDVAGWVRRGEKVERMSLEKAKRLPWCECWNKDAARAG